MAPSRSSRARVILRPVVPHEPNDRGSLPAPLRRISLTSARTGRHQARTERAPPAPARSPALVSAGRSAAGHHARGRRAAQSGHPGRPVLRPGHSLAGDGVGLRRGHRQVNYGWTAARASTTESRPHAEPGGSGPGELQRLSEPRTRRLPRLPYLAAPPGAPDRERRGRVDGRLREARARARTARRAGRVQHLLAEYEARVRV